MNLRDNPSVALILLTKERYRSSCCHEVAKLKISSNINYPDKIICTACGRECEREMGCPISCKIRGNPHCLNKRLLTQACTNFSTEKRRIRHGDISIVKDNTQEEL